MPDPLQRLVLSRTLWLMVAPPLLGFFWSLGRRLRPAAEAQPEPWPRRVGVGSVLLASGATLVHVARLAYAPAGVGALLQRVGSGARIGPVDTGFDLLLDPLSGAACSLACAVAMAGAVLLVSSRAHQERNWKVWAWLELALAGSLLSFLAGGFVTMLLGWTLAGAAGAWLAGWTDRRAGAVRATRAALAMMALLVGATLLGREPEGDAYSDESPSDPTLGATVLGATLGSSGSSSRREAIWSPGAIAAPDRSSLSFSELGASFAAPSDEAPGRGDGVAPALAAFLIAAFVMSPSAPTPGSPLALTAVASGATTSALGPFLLLRLDFLVPLVARGAVAIAVAGALMLAIAGERALLAAKGPLPLRWLALVCGAPAGLTLISLGADGSAGALLVLVAAGLTSAFLTITAVRRGVWSSDVAPPRRGGVDDALLRAGPERAAELLMAFEHWVVDALAGAAAVLLHAAAWTLDRFDSQVLAAPADMAGMRAVRLGRRVEPVIGGSIARVVWAVVVVCLCVAIALAIWPAR